MEVKTGTEMLRFLLEEKEKRDSLPLTQKRIENTVEWMGKMSLPLSAREVNQ